jgi:hypothetical protein
MCLPVLRTEQEKRDWKQEAGNRKQEQETEQEEGI